VIKISPEWVTGPEQGESSGRVTGPEQGKSSGRVTGPEPGKSSGRVATACLRVAFPPFLLKQLYRCDSVVISSFVRTGCTARIQLEYKRNWIQHVNRMPRNRLPRVMKHCCPTGRRNHGRTLKRLLDT
jgi:hypothetical protein